MGRKVWVPAVSGLLTPYAVGYGAWLRAQCYSRSAISDRLWQFDQLSRWLDDEGLAVGQVSAADCARFAASRRAAGRVTLVAPQSMALPIEYLQTIGVTPESVLPLARGLVEELIADYGSYLLIERGLSPHTVFDAYVPAARLFLTGRDGRHGRGGLRLDRLGAADVSVFLARECSNRSVSGTRDLVSALRSFLRYLHLTGRIEAPLVWALPAVADLRDRTLPRGLEPAAVRRLLASCDRRRLVGRRDFAILKLLSRLGLRAGEVAGLQLEDVDWRRGLLLVRGKGGRFDELPLPDDVGQALVSYLRRRPHCSSRAVFVRVTAPRRELNRSTIGWVVRSACDRAALPRVGAHRLRHSAATEMLRHGASLPEIGEVLRHREQKTTAIYAKVDRAALRRLARPWPAPVDAR
jgi:site-specific recombinase XerD